MAKTITNNVRNDEAFAMLHLFEFEMDTDFDGTIEETLYFTDHEIFVYDGTNEYTPIQITFDRLVEDTSMKSDSINISLSNVNSELSATALAKEWRNNACKITRVLYTPPSETKDSITYDYGLTHGGASNVYPKLDISGYTQDTYILFEGIIDTFSASEQTLQGTLTTKFVHWNRPYPTRTYSQNEFTSVVDTIAESIYWGQVKQS